jgi:flagellar hook assembly protein FlgD
MKHAASVLLLALVPIILLGSIMNPQILKFNKYIAPGKYLDRNWRLNEILEEQMGISQWDITGKTEYIYSDSHPTRLDTLKYSYWDGGQQLWIPVQIVSYTYDSTNEYVIHSTTSINLSGNVVPYAQCSFTYDTLHRLTMETIEIMDYDLRDWQLFMWMKINYNTNTDFNGCSFFTGMGDEEMRWDRMNFGWDSQGRVISETHTVSQDSVNWVNSERYLSTYHPNDTTNGDIFVNNVAHYVPFDNDLNEYISPNMFGMTTEELNQVWNNSDWENNNNSVYTYDAGDELTLYQNNNWDTVNTGWINGEKVEYTYNVNENIYQAIRSIWNTNHWEESDRYTCTWGQTTANDDNNLPEPAVLNINASPNPFSDEVVIRTSSKNSLPLELSIYNAKGQLVKSVSTKTNLQYTWNGNDDDLNHVPNGIYFVKASAGGTVKTIKLIKMQ